MEHQATHHDSRLASRIHGATQRAVGALLDTPVEVAIGMGLMLLAWHSIAGSDRDADQLFIRALATGVPVFIAVFGTSVLHAFGTISGRVRAGLTAGIIALGATYGAFVFSLDLQVEWWRWLTLMGAVCMGFALLPMAVVRQRGDAREALWLFNARAISHILGSLGFALALGLGLVFAAAAVDELLGVYLGYKVSDYIMTTMMLGVVPWMVAAMLPTLREERGAVTPQARALFGALCTWLLLPLITLYLCILYAYQFRVVMDGLDTAPKNIMSPLVLAAAMMLVVGILLSEQLERGIKTSRGLFVRACRTLPALFLPLMPMTAWAVWVRVVQYGWTEFRYLRMLLIICLTALFVLATLRAYQRQAQPLAAVFGIFGLAAIVASAGPLSAGEVSRRSQTSRALEALRGTAMLDGEERLVRVDASQENGTTPEQASAALDYLGRTHGLAGLEPLLHEDTYEALARLVEDREDPSIRFHDLALVLGWDGLMRGESSRAYTSLEAPTPRLVPAPGTLHDFSLHESMYAPDGLYVQEDAGGARIEFDGERLTVTHLCVRAEADVQTLASLVVDAHTGKRTDRPESWRVPLMHGDAQVGHVLVKHFGLLRERRDTPWRWGDLTGQVLWHVDEVAHEVR